MNGIFLKYFPGSLKQTFHRCPVGRSSRRPGKRKQKDITDLGVPLERFCTDLVGPIRVPSLSESQYVLTMIDEWDGLSQVQFIRRKSQAADSLKDTITELQNEISASVNKLVIMNRTKIKWLRSDSGGEYVCTCLQSWLKAGAIVHEVRVLYSPESNGKAEQLNCTLLDMARSMMCNTQTKNANRFWAEAVSTANYLCNRLHTRKYCTKKTPFEVIFQ